jgi:branched-chain amino acid aminotransferase
MAKGTHDYVQDPRNETILISINGDLVARAQATVSVFDSGFILGDGIWEGLRLHDGGIPFLHAHLRRLYEGARAIDMDIGLSPEELTERIFACTGANAMQTGVHIRLMVSRGVKATPYQDPRVTISPPTIVIIPEYKAPLPATLERGISLFTVHVRRGAPDVQDPKAQQPFQAELHHRLHPGRQGRRRRGADARPHGFVATCNSTHFFIVRDGALWTSTGDYCIPGITRGAILKVAREAGMTVAERNFSLTDVHGADEAFVTGTFAGVTPVREIDGRTVGGLMAAGPPAMPGPVTLRLRGLYKALVERETVRP